MEQPLRLSSAMRHVFPLTGLASGYVCLRCRHRGLAIARNARIFPSPSASTSFRRQYAGDTLTERIRQKIWKTEPPGQKDPYNASQLEPPGQKDSYNVNERDASQADEVRRKGKDGDEQDDQGGQYVPATTWDGLERIGGPTGWWEEAWDKAHPFEGFMAPKRMESKADISIAIHRALVEVFTLQQAGLAVKFPTLADAPYDSDWGAVGFQQVDDRTIVPIFPNEQTRQKILRHLTNSEPQDDITADPAAEAVEALETEEEMKRSDEKTEESDEERDEGPQVLLDEGSSPEGGELELVTADTPEDQIIAEDETISSPSLLVDQSWLNVPLNNPKIKFLILKRVMQLTGTRIPDPAIADLTSAKMLLGHLARKPRPKKLADRLFADESISSLPNIHIMDRRYTPIDKEKEIGRWKVIEKELISRDLPVTGPGFGP